MISLKHEIRSRIRIFSYSPFIQNLLCNIAVFYMKLVYATCRKTFINYEKLASNLGQGRPIIVAMWHGRIMMASFVAQNVKNKGKAADFIVLASRHKDGQLVSKIMSKFGFENVSASGVSRKETLGHNLNALKEIIKSIRSGKNFSITPDGPRGPKYKIKGQVVNIAKLTGAPILPFSYSCKNHIKLKSWDEFMIPLPFSKLCYYFEDLLWVDKDASDEEVERLKLVLEDKINSAMNKADAAVKSAKLTVG